jgi:hypothetical protein
MMHGLTNLKSVFIDLLVYKYVSMYSDTVIARDDAAAVAVFFCTLECIRIVRPCLHICLLSKYGNSKQTLEAAGRLQYLIRCVKRWKFLTGSVFSGCFSAAILGLGSKILQ